jgi:hypothetical protein
VTTGEFVNVGVVMHLPREGRLLAKARTKGNGVHIYEHEIVPKCAPQPIHDTAGRWPNVNTKAEKCVVCAALLNMAVEPLAMCYPGLVGGT